MKIPGNPTLCIQWLMGITLLSLLNQITHIRTPFEAGCMCCTKLIPPQQQVQAKQLSAARLSPAEAVSWR